jgi:TolA-binding protein
MLRPRFRVGAPTGESTPLGSAPMPATPRYDDHHYNAHASLQPLGVGVTDEPIADIDDLLWDAMSPLREFRGADYRASGPSGAGVVASFSSSGPVTGDGIGGGGGVGGGGGGGVLVPLEPPVGLESITMASNVVQRIASALRARAAAAEERLAGAERGVRLWRSGEWLADHEALGWRLVHELSAAHSASARHVAQLAVREMRRRDDRDAASAVQLKLEMAAERSNSDELSAKCQGLEAQVRALQKKLAEAEQRRLHAVAAMRGELEERDDAVARLQQTQLKLLRQLASSSTAAVGGGGGGGVMTAGGSHELVVVDADDPPPRGLSAFASSPPRPRSASPLDRLDHHSAPPTTRSRRGSASAVSSHAAGNGHASKSGTNSESAVLPGLAPSTFGDLKAVATRPISQVAPPSSATHMARAVASLPPELLRLLHSELTTSAAAASSN